MTFRVSWTRLSLVAAATMLAPGCHRARDPEAGTDRTAEAGVPISFGAEAAPEARWDLGDGTKRTAARVTHVYERSGTYRVRALVGDREVSSAAITVVARPAVRAVPADVTIAVVVPRLGSDLRPLLELVDRVSRGSPSPRTAWLEAFTRRRAEQSEVIDPEEGVGLFTLEGVDANVAFVGIADSERAVDVVLEELDAQRQDQGPASDGLVQAVDPEGERMFLFVDRGYLYAVLPDAPEDRAGGDDAAPRRTEADGRELARRLRARISSGSAEGLSTSPRYAKLRAKVSPGQAWAFAGFGSEEGPAPVLDAALVSVTASGERADLEGFVSSKLPLILGNFPGGGDLFRSAPLGPILAAYFAMESQTWASLALGAPGSAQRASRVAQLAKEGLDVEGLFAAFRGDVAAVAYADVPALMRSVANRRTGLPRGLIRIGFGVRDPEAVLAFARTMWRNEAMKESTVEGDTRLEIALFGQPLSLTAGGDRAVIELGDEQAARPTGDLRSSLSEAFGSSVLADGRFTALVDLGQLRREVSEAREVPGLEPSELALTQRLTAAVIDQFTPLERAFVDLAPEEGGARLRASLSVRREAR